MSWTLSNLRECSLEAQVLERGVTVESSRREFAVYQPIMEVGEVGVIIPLEGVWRDSIAD